MGRLSEEVIAALQKQVFDKIKKKCEEEGTEIPPLIRELDSQELKKKHRMGPNTNQPIFSTEFKESVKMVARPSTSRILQGPVPLTGTLNYTHNTHNGLQQAFSRDLAHRERLTQLREATV